MYDLTATLSYVVCGCVQRLGIPDLMRASPLGSALAPEMSEFLNGSRERLRAAARLRTTSPHNE
jgi:hypothetical protein